MNAGNVCPARFWMIFKWTPPSVNVVRGFSWLLLFGNLWTPEIQYNPLQRAHRIDKRNVDWAGGFALRVRRLHFVNKE